MSCKLEHLLNAGIYGTQLLVRYYQADLLQEKKELAEEMYHQELFDTAQNTAKEIT